MYIFFALAGAASAGIGAALMKFGMATQFPEISLGNFLSQWRKVAATIFTNKVWLLGLLLGVASGFFLAQAMAGGDLTVVQILANTGGAWSIFIGVVFFSEKLSRGEWVAVAIMLCGALLVSFSPEATGHGDPQMNRLLATVVVVAMLMVASYLYSRLGRMTVGLEFLLAAVAGLAFALINAFMKLATWEVAVNVGAFNALGPETWGWLVTHLPFWAILFCLFPGLFFLHGAFSHGRVSVVMPLHVAFINLLTILCALIVFNEEMDLPRMAGLIVSMGGAWVLAKQTHVREE